MNLTLSIDTILLKEARKAAIEMDTTVNSLVRSFLQELVDKKKHEKHLFLDEWHRLMKENPVQMQKRTWNREELHER